MRNFCNLIGLEKWYFKITYNNFEILLVVFKPNNITINHANTILIYNFTCKIRAFDMEVGDPR